MGWRDAYSEEQLGQRRDYQNRRAKRLRAERPEYAAQLNREQRERKASGQYKPSKYDREKWYYDYHIKRLYGLTREQFMEMASDGCQLCGARGEDVKFGNLTVDHCHTTGKVRGVLCRLCNAGLGHFRDDVSRLRAAIAYLQKHGESR